MTQPHTPAIAPAKGLLIGLTLAAVFAALVFVVSGLWLPSCIDGLATGQPRGVGQLLTAAHLPAYLCLFVAFAATPVAVFFTGPGRRAMVLTLLWMALLLGTILFFALGSGPITCAAAVSHFDLAVRVFQAAFGLLLIALVVTRRWGIA